MLLIIHRRWGQYGVHARAPLPCTMDRRRISRNLILIAATPATSPSLTFISKMTGRRAAANLMSKDEARKIAAGIAKLPELLKRPQH
jgi:hypothetical protein